MNPIWSQIFGGAASVAVLASMQLKNIKAVLIMQVLCNLAGAASYIVNGNVSACGLYLVAVVQASLFLSFRLRDKEAPGFFTWIFTAAFILCSLLTFRKMQDVAPMLAAVCCALGLAQKKSSVYRLLMLANGLLWVTYDVIACAYGMIPAHMITALSAIVGILRMDLSLLKKKNK